MFQQLYSDLNQYLASFFDEEIIYKMTEIKRTFDKTLDINKAAEYGCLEMIKWLRQNGALWNVNVY